MTFNSSDLSLILLAFLAIIASRAYSPISRVVKTRRKASSPRH